MDDLSIVTSRTIEEAVAEVLVTVAGEARTVWDTSGCSADAFASVQVRHAPPPVARVGSSCGTVGTSLLKTRWIESCLFYILT